ncbi:DUF1833 family protein [Megalodesulfovibrio gigas]|uniref:DUF1833 domain-containing protein n=1 Tax=Megalodesulfovibrio gigas (strain ATCC 19364 / DSM 1382 / NCIMB 9332 / VKM B-1759) TaxID=1121448 RepID=T2G9N9_MEGG1|nr:DUF1833 family protein [Megalodesulfovibrio gigas]AGW12846.1 hypothetical protein DGI_0964 [Megalodesulfovibrio gigas DSM 1382 = ATCC 19364]
MTLQSISMTEAMQEAIACAPADLTHYETLELTHDALADPIRVVRSFEPLHTPQGTYFPAQFELRLPETSERVCGELIVSTGPVPRQVFDALVTIDRFGGDVLITYRHYLGPAQPPDMVIPTALKVSSIVLSPAGAELRARFANLTGIPFPRRLMTATRCPGAM